MAWSKTKSAAIASSLLPAWKTPFKTRHWLDTPSSRSSALDRSASVGVVSKPIDLRGREGGVGEDAGPFAEGHVRGEDDGLGLVPAVHDLEKDVGGGVVVGQVTHSVDHKRDAS